MDKNKWILPVSILLGCVILGGFYYGSQVSKQRSVDKQQAIKTEMEKKADYFEKKKECEKYTDSIKADLSVGRLSENYFEMVFYSPKDNSCIFTYQRMGYGEIEYFVANALTKSKITSFKFPDQWEDYKKFLLEYSDGEIRL